MRSNFGPAPLVGWGPVTPRAAASASATRQWRDPHLLCAHNSNVGKLAGAIAAHVRLEEHSCTIDAIGPECCYHTLKAVILAAEYLEKTRSGQTLCFTPEKDPEWMPSLYSGLAGGGLRAPPGTEKVLTRLHVRPCPAMEESSQEHDILVAGDTNTGTMAVLLVKALEDQGQATMAAVGPGSASVAIEAMLIAQVYMQNSPSCKGQVITGLVRKAVFRGEPVSDRKAAGPQDGTRMVFTCFLASPTPL